MFLLLLLLTPPQGLHMSAMNFASESRAMRGTKGAKHFSQASHKYFSWEQSLRGQ